MLNNIIKANTRQELVLNSEWQYNHVEVQILVLKGAK